MNRHGRHVRANGLVLLWLAAAAVVAVAHRWVPGAGWLMVHLLLLGGASTAILVWSQHFTDTLLRRAGSPRVLAARLAAHSLGAVLVVAGVAGRSTLATVTGAVLVAAAATDQVVRVLRQRRGGLPARFAHLVRYYVAAGACLVPGVAAGVVMARLPVDPDLHGRLTVAHVGLTVLGWIGLTVAGTLVVLWPTVLRTRIDDATERAARRALPVLVGGLVVLAGAAVAGVRPLAGAGSVAVSAGVVLLAVPLARLVRAGGVRTFAMLSLAAAVVWWAGAALVLGLRVAAATSWEPAAAAVAGLTPAVVVGFAAQVLVASLSQLLPVVLGGGPAVVRETSALLDRGGVVRVVLLNGCLAVFVLPAPSSVGVAVSTVGLGALVAFLVLAVRAVLLARRLRSQRASAAAPAGAGVAAPDVVVAGRTAGPVPVALARPTDGAALPGDPVAGARRRGAATVGVAGLVAAVVLGVAVDPVAAGLGAGPVAAGASAAATGRTTTVDVEAQDMRFSPDRVEVPAGDRLVIRLTNTDAAVHDLVLPSGASSGRLEPGRTVEVDAGVVTADQEGWCSVAGHRLMGMTLDVVVVGEVPGTVLAGPERDEDEATPHAGGDAHATGAHRAVRDPSATPEPGFTARDAALPALHDAGPTTHRVTLRVQEVEQEVAPGVVQTVWTFGGSAPGPVLHGRVGDRFEVTLVNDGSVGHSVDFHAGALAPDRPMRTIAPGERLTYTFTAERSGVWTYHCSTAPMSLHMANGMVGAVVIDPPGLPPVDREYVLVQSEAYLGPQGGTADEAAVAAGTPDVLMFNGYADQYVHDPLPAVAGERVRVWVLDAGPNRPSAFHVVGGQFDTVYREGDWTLRDGGSTGTGGAQVLALQPAEGGFVELTFPEAGHYPFVTHAMSDAERGAKGVFAVSGG